MRLLVSHEGRRGWIKIAILLLVLLIALLIILVPALQNTVVQFLLSPFQERAPVYASYRFEKTIKVNANGGTVTSFTLDLPVPYDLIGPGYSLQDVEPMDAMPEGQDASRYGLEWLEWEHGPISGTQSYQVRITYQMRVDTHIWSVDQDGSGTIDDVPPSLKSAYLHNEWLSDDGWMIDISNGQIQQKAQDIVGQEKNVYAILDHIYEWIVRNIDYPTSNLQGLPKTSIQTLNSMVGDCDDQSMLFCSLARAAGVPAWPQMGVLYDENNDEWYGHGWVQAFIPLKEGGYLEVVIDTVNRDFLVWMPDRMAEYTDDGNGEHLSDYYYSFTYYYDELTYPLGGGPSYEESYRSLNHEESGETVNVGSILDTVAPQPLEFQCASRIKRMIS